jgi:hypothetical protein
MNSVRQLKLISLPERGKGWARLDFENPEYGGGYASLVICRNGHAQAFLGAEGWQGAESHLRIDFETLDSTTGSLYLPPPVVQYLEYGFNYQFQLFNALRDRVGEMIIRWTGKPYRPSDGKAPPIEIISPYDIPVEDITIGASPLSQENDYSVFEPAVMGAADALDIGVPKEDAVPELSTVVSFTDQSHSEPTMADDSPRGSLESRPTWAPRSSKVTRVLCSRGHEMIKEVGYCIWCEPRLKQ